MNKIRVLISCIYVAYVRAPWGQFTSRLFNKTSVVPNTFKRVTDITAYMGSGGEWRRDKGLMKDRYIHPAVTAKRISDGFNDKDSFDCDDHALFMVAALHKTPRLSHKLWVGIVQYRYRDTGKKGAHAVTIYKDVYGGVFWVDYNKPKACGSSFWAQQVADGYNAQALSWAVMPVKDVTESDTVKFSFPSRTFT